MVDGVNKDVVDLEVVAGNRTPGNNRSPKALFPPKNHYLRTMTQYIADEAHFKEVLAKVPTVKRSLWIGTADIKDLYVEDRPFLGILADLTGAGIGMKGAGNRNFEAGILTDDPELVEAAMNQFDSVWAGFKCKTCRRKQYCGDPILK